MNKNENINHKLKIKIENEKCIRMVTKIRWEKDKKTFERILISVVYNN